MTEARELYQELILDHNRSPRNFGKLERAQMSAEGYNPLCGDRIVISLNLNGDRIESVMFDGTGCAISKASASMMTSSIKGRTIIQAKQLFEAFHRLITQAPGNETDAEALGKLAVFSGVWEYPSRVKCATLPWVTLKAAFEKKGDRISTE